MAVHGKIPDHRKQGESPITGKAWHASHEPPPGEAAASAVEPDSRRIGPPEPDLSEVAKNELDRDAASLGLDLTDIESDLEG